MNKFSNYTSLDLLEKVFEFSNMTPDRSEWSLDQQKDNIPRLIRLKQINSLLLAFLGIEALTNKNQKNIEHFLSGEFILKRKIADYRQLIAKMEKTISQSSFKSARKQEISLSNLKTNFTDLVEYRFKLNRLLNHNSGLMEISYPYCFSYLVTDSISNSISPVGPEIDGLLAIFIDPQKRSYSEKELISSFDFPTENLSDIDDDWM